MAPTLILGVGNILLRDEGVGVRVVEALGAYPLPPGVELCDGGTAGADLINVMAGRRTVIVVDAVDADAEAGAVFRFTRDDIVSPERANISLHELGLAEALRMADALGCAPGEVIVFGVQPNDITPGLDLSADVAAVVPHVCELVLAEVEKAPTSSRRWISERAPAHTRRTPGRWRSPSGIAARPRQGRRRDR
jgi:hydrogenase maturation protease